MKKQQNLTALAVTLITAAAMVACDKPGAGESAGKAVDRAVEEAGQKLDEGSAKAAAIVDDAAITANVKSALLAESGLKSLQINVETVKGVVMLRGTVDSQAHSELAVAMAGGVAGVHSVMNHLVVTAGN
jgi:hyperosmotically inducible protein